MLVMQTQKGPRPPKGRGSFFLPQANRNRRAASAQSPVPRLFVAGAESRRSPTVWSGLTFNVGCSSGLDQVADTLRMTAVARRVAVWARF